MFDNIRGCIHLPPTSQFVLCRGDALLKSCEDITAQYLLTSPLPPPLQFLPWFSKASSRNPDSQRWSWHTESSSNGANLSLTSSGKQVNQSWQDVQCIACFCQDDSTAYRDGLLTLCTHANKVFIHQPLRMYLYGLYIYKCQLEAWIFDRSGIWVCQAFNIQDNPQRFLAMILSYRSMSDADLGLSSVVKRDDNGSFVTFNDTVTPGLQKLYLEDKTIALSDDLVGQGTTCYRARSSGRDQWDYVIKVKWRPADRRPEEEILNLAMQKKAWGIVTANLRQGLHFGPYYELAPLHNETDTPPRVANSGEEPNISKLVTPTKTPFQNRIFTCVVTSPIGRPLQFFATRLELLLALRDAVRAHRSLFQDAKVLHQDISVWNILISHPQRPGDPHGILIDLDVAINVAEGGLRKLGGAIGTRPFMAIGVLLRRIHTYRHDLESFLYVLLWVVVVRQKDYPPVGSRLREWNQGSLADSARLKTSDMAEDSFGNVLAEFEPEFESLKGLAERLRGLLFPRESGELWTGTVGSGAGINRLYDAFIDTF
ncbi:serine/threonine-protein kinase Sgk2 [Aaosphaeria arxii CBS 175.79]|uniref:Serine/threonine-protein kinase Sgk2 n=1 Tax=Aaosphaeria arxii CBS 175.79 TaxID=1450172 RepID=A0A6A5XCC1_9PLEO|nr:serine/threonine-protein kinase Sgk2 [Aaosphaeria arxii CBS 175.79]KAF2010457.1 serine/threonine-protein kinase Sgk2 [Aaosphaeria arxii CBS 175.79]